MSKKPFMILLVLVAVLLLFSTQAFATGGNIVPGMWRVDGENYLTAFDGSVRPTPFSWEFRLTQDDSGNIRITTGSYSMGEWHINSEYEVQLAYPQIAFSLTQPYGEGEHSGLLWWKYEGVIAEGGTFMSGERIYGATNLEDETPGIWSAHLYREEAPLEPEAAPEFNVAGVWEIKWTPQHYTLLQNQSYYTPDDISYVESMLGKETYFGYASIVINADGRGNYFISQYGGALSEEINIESFVQLPNFFLKYMESSRFYQEVDDDIYIEYEIGVDILNGVFESDTLLTGEATQILYAEQMDDSGMYYEVTGSYPWAELTGRFTAQKVSTPPGTAPAGATAPPGPGAPPGSGYDPRAAGPAPFTTPGRQAAATAGAAAVMTLAALLMHASQGAPLAGAPPAGRGVPLTGNPAAAAAAGGPPRMTGADGKEYVWYKPEGDLAHEPFWCPVDRYEADQWHHRQGHVFQDNMWYAGQAEAEATRNWREQVSRENEQRHQAHLKEQDAKKLREQEEQQRLKQYMAGDFGVEIGDIRIAPEIREAMEKMRQDNRDFREAMANNKIKDGEAGYRLARMQQRIADVGYYGTKVVGIAADKTIDTLATALNGGAPVGLGTAIQAPYKILRDTGSEVSKYYCGDKDAADSLFDATTRGVATGTYDAATSVAANYLKISDRGQLTEFAWNFSVNTGEEALFGEGNYDAVLLNTLLNSVGDAYLDGDSWAPEKLVALLDLPIGELPVELLPTAGFSEIAGKTIYEFLVDEGVDVYTDWKDQGLSPEKLAELQAKRNQARGIRYEGGK